MKTAKQPKISVIIPVYNVEKYLRQCLDSVINQTLQDIEIICVNDGSTDSCPAILQEYALNDKRLTVINKINEGQGIARNLGICRAKGEFIGFVDPDDWIESEMYETLYRQAKNLDSDVVICDYEVKQEWSGKSWVPATFSEQTDIQGSRSLYVDGYINLPHETIEKFLLISPCYTWHRIYKADFLKKKQIFFSDLRCYEDCGFILKTHLTANGVSYCPQPLYHYRRNKSSTLHHYSERWKDGLAVYEELKDILNKMHYMGNTPPVVLSRILSILYS